MAVFLVLVGALQPTALWYISTYAAYFAAGLFILTLMLNLQNVLLKAGPLLLMVFFLAWVFLTTVASPHREVATGSCWYISKVWMMGLIIVVACRNYEQLTLYLKAVVLGSFALAISGSVLGYSAVAHGGERVQGIAEQANAFGASLFHGILAGVVLFPYVGKLWKAIVGVYFVAALIAMLASGSRGAAAGTVAVFFVYAIIEHWTFILKRPFAIIPAIAVAVGPVFIAVKFFPESPLVSRSLELFEGRTGASSGRIDIYRTAWELFVLRPWLGQGFGTFRVYTRWVYTHSTFMDLLFGGGVLAFALYYSLYAYAWLLLSRLIKVYKESVACRRTLNAWKAVLVGFLVHGAFADVYAQKLPMCLLAGILGFATMHTWELRRFGLYRAAFASTPRPTRTEHVSARSPMRTNLSSDIHGPGT